MIRAVVQEEELSGYGFVWGLDLSAWAICHVERGLTVSLGNERWRGVCTTGEHGEGHHLPLDCQLNSAEAWINIRSGEA